MSVPSVPCMDAIPSRAISVLVSNPSPNKTPIGYIFHGQSINLNILFRTLNSGPPPSKLSAAGLLSAPTGNARMRLSRTTSLYKIQAFMAPSKIKNAAETLFPMMPPTRPKLPKCSLMPRRSCGDDDTRNNDDCAMP
jgi:hypothetical protein